GCFHANYPSLVWEQEECLPPPTYESIPPAQIGKGSATVAAGTNSETSDVVSAADGAVFQTVGNGYDYAAKTSGTFGSTTGSFPTVTGVTSASTDAYTLQINTNNSAGPAALCKGYSISNCTTWQQFIYASAGPNVTPGPAAIFIQNWIFPLPKRCPSGWTRSVAGGGCVKNSAAVTVSTVALSDLAKAKLSGSASTSGNDVVTFTYGTTVKSVSQKGSTLDIGSTWNKSEFNVFGNGSTSPVVSFNKGSSLTVKVEVNDGTTRAPTCTGPTGAGETYEQNNLTLGACTAAGGSSPYIQFTQSN
ncbi:MAG: hypothetical protein IJI03_01685, partial [Rudaea sp.]|nr:hypothetical protein [Rudaea sp.]